MEGDEFPELPAIENDKPIYISALSLLEGLKGTLFATSADETKQVLTGVHIKFGAQKLEFASTDGHRLAVVETANSNNEKSDEDELVEVTVPARALRELERMLNNSADAEEIIALKLDDGQAVFE